MPLVKIHVFKGVWSPEELRRLADEIQSVMVATFNAPAKDRFQIITQHESNEIIADDYGLGLNRTERLVIIRIFQQGRTAETKQKTFAALAEALTDRCGISGDDLVVSICTNAPSDWILGLGHAQLVNGDL